ncbi:MAG: YaeQ family protein [Desulfuromonadales bacterium]
MAQPSSIYRANIQLADVDRGIYETLQATVARHPSETEERLVARLLAYSLFFEPGIAFTKGISAVDEPDLWVKGPDGRVLLWMEVGIPESDRIVKACRHTERAALVACGKAFLSWEQQHLPKLVNIPNLTVISFDQTFINCLTSKLDRTINWDVTITDGNLYINVGVETYDTVLKVRTGKR